MSCHADLFSLDSSGFFLFLFLPCLSSRLRHFSCMQTERSTLQALEHYKDYVESINCPKWDKGDKKCINL